MRQGEDRTHDRDEAQADVNGEDGLQRTVDARPGHRR